MNFTPKSRTFYDRKKRVEENMVPEVEIPSPFQGKLTDTGFEPRGILCQDPNLRRFPIIFKHLNIKHLEKSSWNSLG